MLLLLIEIVVGCYCCCVVVDCCYCCCVVVDATAIAIMVFAAVINVVMAMVGTSHDENTHGNQFAENKHTDKRIASKKQRRKFQS